MTKRVLSSTDAEDVFSGFPVVLGTVRGEKDNVITLALCHVFSFKPALIGVGIAPARFSFRLFKESKDFAINVPDVSLLRAVKICGSKSGKKLDKFEAAGLTREKASKVSAPLIAECPVNIECVKTHEIDTGDHTWFVGEIVAARQREDYDKGKMLLYWGDYRTIGEKVGKG
ncbi:MAG: flavin reductase family protein [Thermoplasmata archaeon]|nr:flavin reductase family protein [Thermoplasmata archaeon]